MKKVLLVLAVMAVSFTSNAQKWALDKSHAGVTFTVTHMMISEVDGNFGEFDASITSSKEDLSDAVFEFTAKTSSVNTQNERRDGHLQAEEYFHTEKYPTIKFKSTSLKKVEGKKYKMTGDLTMKDVTKEITMDVIINGPIVHPRSKKNMVGIKATGEIDRFDFHVGGESGAGTSREIVISAKGEFTQE